MKKFLGSFLSAVILICLITTLPVFAADENSSEHRTITVQFPGMGGKVHTWDFPYSDDYFRHPANEFSNELARATLGLSFSAFQSTKQPLKLQYKTYLKKAGFKDIYAFGYDEETSKDSLAGVIGWKQIDDFILIAATPRGQGYEKEWAGNLEVGDEERHVGFNHGAKILEEQLKNYMDSHGLSGKAKLWLGGFSRAAAVSNLTAADMIDSGRFEDVFAYLFGVPRTTKATELKYDSGIFNICGKNDPVPKIPLESWGYNRYGQTMYTPTMEADSNYPNMVTLATYVSLKISGEPFNFNPELNYQIQLILEFLNEMFPSSKEYAEQFQDVIMTVWTEANPERMLNILAEVADQMAKLDERRANSSKIFIDYISMIASQHMMEDSKQIRDGYWNPDLSIAENTLYEHLPVTYLCWVFSNVPETELYYTTGFTRRLSVFGDVDVEIWKDGIYIKGIDRNGNAIFKEGFEGNNIFDLMKDPESYSHYLQSVFITRNGTETIVNIPTMESITVIVRVPKVTSLAYYDIFCSPYTTLGMSDTMFVQTLAQGEYQLSVRLIDSLPALTAINGEVISTSETNFQYSPTFVMANESNSTSYAKMEEIIGTVFGTVVSLILILLICLIIAIIHKIRKRKRGVPYSPWFVIVPHLLLILLFFALSLYISIYLFTIMPARIVCAGLTMLVIFLLALRGFLRNRNLVSLLIAAGLLILSAVNILLYQRSSMFSSSTIHLVIYSACIVFFTVMAVLTFFIRRKPSRALAT